MEQLRRPDRRLQDARDVVTFIRGTLSNRVDMSSRRRNREAIRRHFQEIPVESIARTEPWNCDPIPGSRSFHSISSISAADSTKLMVRYFSCFCRACQLQAWDRCENPQHVTPWQLVKLKPHNTRLARNKMIQELERDDDSQYGGDVDDMIDILEIGDHFAVLAEDNNDEGVPYYILQCQRTKFVAGEDFECVWGNRFEVGDHVVEGIYFQNWGAGSQNYVYLSGSCLAFIHSHLVKATKFPMILLDHRVKGDEPIYKLLDEHHSMISGSMQ
jgi:hypothetical protein